MPSQSDVLVFALQALVGVVLALVGILVLAAIVACYAMALRGLKRDGAPEAGVTAPSGDADSAHAP